MFSNQIHQPKEEIFGGLLLAASVCWTACALAFAPSASHASVDVVTIAAHVSRAANSDVQVVLDQSTSSSPHFA